MTTYVLVDTFNSQVFGPFGSEQAAEDAARTGRGAGGVPWGEDGWFVTALCPVLVACRHCGEARIHANHQLLPPVSGFHAFEESAS